MGDDSDAAVTLYVNHPIHEQISLVFNWVDPMDGRMTNRTSGDLHVVDVVVGTTQRRLCCSIS